MNSEKNNMYYDPGTTLSYNALFNFVVGIRGCGKTVGYKMHVADRFLKNGSEFVYIRRYETDLENSLIGFWNIPAKINEKYEGFKVKGDTFYKEGKQVGRAIALSKASNYKSSDFSNVDFVIFDEFQIEGSQLYIKGMDEVKVFLNLYESINRERDIPVVFLGNPVTVTNPYFLWFDIGLPYNGKEIQRFHDYIVVHHVRSNEFKEYKKSTKFGALIEGSGYGDYSLDGSALNDNARFIRKRPEKSNYFLTAVVKDARFGIWYCTDDYSFHVSKKIDPGCRYVFSFDFDSHSENTLIARRFKQTPHIQQLVSSFKYGMVYYDNINVKNTFYGILKKMCF